MRIVEDVPGVLGLGVRRLVRGVAVLLGVVLVLGGLLCAVLPVALALGTVSILIEGNDVTPPTGRAAAELGLLVAGAAVALWLGLRLIRGRRRVGLYLRKFGFVDTTRTVSHALGSAVGRSVRLITLDDSMVAPMGAGRARRRVAGLVWLASAAGAGWLLFYVFGGGYQRDSDRIFADAAAQADNPLAETVGAAFLGGLVSALLLLLTLAVVGLALGFAVLGGGSYLAARRAESSASQALTSERTVTAAARRLAAAGRRIFAPRLAVVGVPTAYWQRAVYALAGVSDVLIIDVSQPTANLLWEVQHIKPLFAGRWVLVGARDRIAPLTRPHLLPPGTPAAALARLLDGEEVIAYGPDGYARQRFARALRRRLERLR